MKRLLLILSLLLVVTSLTIAVPLSAQGNGNRDNSNRVYILVVDDFGDHFTALTNRLRGNAATLTQLRNAVQQLPRRGSNGNGNGNRNNNRNQGQPTATPLPQVSLLRQNLRQQARQAVSASVQGNIDQQNCSIVPEGQSFFATSGTSFFATSGTGFFATSGTGSQAAPLPHGVRVSAQLQELIKKYGGQNKIDVVPVDTDGYTTSLISDRITQTITQLSNQHPNASFVVNMSFAVVPCAALADLAVYDALMHQADADLAGDLDAMQAVFTSMMSSGVFDQSLTSNDNLQGLVNARCNRRSVCNSGTNKVILVAASGNSGASFPFYPAAWNGVESVSASVDDTDFIGSGAIAPYSNFGAIMMPGVWGNEMGTSFAAPRYSFSMALYLLSNQAATGCPALSPAAAVDWLTAPPATPNLKLC
jgi:Subtilase family